MKQFNLFPPGTRRGMLALALLGLAVQPMLAQSNGEPTEVRKVKIVKDVNGQVTVVEKEVPAGMDVQEFLRTEGLAEPDGPGLPPLPPSPEGLQKGDRVEVNVEVGPDGNGVRRMTVVRDGKVIREDVEAVEEGNGEMVFTLTEPPAGEMVWEEKEGQPGEKQIIIRKMECEGPENGQKREIRMVMIRIEDVEESTPATEGAAAKTEPLPIESLDLFPNPNDGKFTLRFRTEESTKPVRIRISDLNGKTIVDKKLKMEGEEFSESFDLSSLPKGAYLLQLEQQGKTHSKKIVLQ